MSEEASCHSHLHFALTQSSRIFTLSHEALLSITTSIYHIKPVYTPLALRDWFGAAPETRSGQKQTYGRTGNVLWPPPRRFVTKQRDKMCFCYTAITMSARKTFRQGCAPTPGQRLTAAQ